MADAIPSWQQPRIRERYVFDNLLGEAEDSGDIGGGGSTDLSDYYTKEQVDELLADFTVAAATRATAQATTSSLAADAADAVTTMSLAKGYLLYSIQTSRPARVQLYESAAARDADAVRAVGTDPAADAGVVLDYLTADTSAHALGPVVLGASLAAPPTTDTAMRVTNRDSSTGTVTVTLVWLKVE